MKSMIAVFVIQLILIVTVLGGCGGNRETDTGSDPLLDGIMQELREEQAVPEWWKHDLPQHDDKITMQELPIYPAFIWSFLIPDNKTTMLHGLEHVVNEYILQRAVYEFGTLKQLTAQNPETKLPGQYSFLIPKAEENYRIDGEVLPTIWTVETTLKSFINEKEAFSDFKYYYFKEYYYHEGTTEVFNISTASDAEMKITIEPDIASIAEMTGKEPTPSDLKDVADRAIIILTNLQNSFDLESFLIQKSNDTTVTLYTKPYETSFANAFTFCLIDEEETQSLQDFTSKKPGSIFDKDGNIRVPDASGSELLVRGYYRFDIDKETFEVEYLVISEVTGLGTSHIEKIEFGKDLMDKPQITLQLNDEGGELFYQITSENIKRTLAILMDDRVLMQAVIAEPIRDSIRINGVTEEEARNIIKQFRNRAK